MKKARFGRALLLTVGLMAMPTAALAVSVSSNDGSGNQSMVAGINQSSGLFRGAIVNGTLRSTSGKTVYYSGKIALSGCIDINTGRYSTNTSSLTSVTRGGEISRLLTTCTGYQGVKSRVCTVRNNFPDACGSDSATYGG